MNIDAETKTHGGQSLLTDGLAGTLRWLPRCYCGALATREQTWSDRGPLYYCDREDCDKEARKAHDEDHEYDQTGLERGECLWAETAR